MEDKMAIATLGGGIRVMPAGLLRDLVEGKKKLSDCEDFEIVILTIIRDWLNA